MKITTDEKYAQKVDVVVDRCRDIIIECATEHAMEKESRQISEFMNCASNILVNLLGNIFIQLSKNDVDTYTIYIHTFMRQFHVWQEEALQELNSKKERENNE